jgi:uncharacterized protein (DUF305 family)
MTLLLAVLAAPAAMQAQASPRERPAPLPAETRFLQGMIGHHAQAVTMAALVESRTTSRVVRLIAERITVSQQDEIALMRRWLTARGVTPSDPAHAHHDLHGDHQMPGMLTTAQLDTLAAARGIDFDRAFLRYMIQHHKGAIVMVRELFATPGAGQESALNRFARDVSTDQRAEIARMRRELDAITPRAAAP